MKTILLFIAFTLLSGSFASAKPEITPDDIARHLGIHFWKFDATSLPPKFSVALIEIKNGKRTAQSIGMFSFPANSGDLVVAISTKDGLAIPTISAGPNSAGVDQSMWRKVGMSVRHNINEIKPGVLTVICGDYKSAGEATVATGKVEDVISGFALLVEEIR